MIDITKLLKENTYPGRGIIVGCCDNTKSIVALYFIMGRSENSRNRIFVKTDEGIRTEPFDPALMTNPELIIYNPVRRCSGHTIITNGDQTDTIYEFMSKGSDFRSALLTREFEPDAPNYTPRISCLIKPDGSYALSILKTAIDHMATSRPECCIRHFFEYSNAIPGLGHFISTYQNDGNPLPSFIGEPIPIAVNISGDFKSYVHNIWAALNNDNKVSIYGCEIDINNNLANEIIINQLQGNF